MEGFFVLEAGSYIPFLATGKFNSKILSLTGTRRWTKQSLALGVGGYLVHSNYRSLNQH